MSSHAVEIKAPDTMIRLILFTYILPSVNVTPPPPPPPPKVILSIISVILNTVKSAHSRSDILGFLLATNYLCRDYQPVKIIVNFSQAPVVRVSFSVEYMRWSLLSVMFINRYSCSRPGHGSNPASLSD